MPDRPGRDSAEHPKAVIVVDALTIDLLDAAIELLAPMQPRCLGNLRRMRANVCQALAARIDAIHADGGGAVSGGTQASRRLSALVDSREPEPPAWQMRLLERAAREFSALEARHGRRTW